MKIENAIAALSANVPADDDVFERDGLLFCRRCGTPRQCRVNILGQQRIAPCLCQCLEEARAARKFEQERAEQALAIEQYRSAGFPDREMARYRFERDNGSQPKIRRAMEKYVEQFADFRKDGKGLLLYGNVGTGKSFYAACVVNALIDRGYPCAMTNFSRLTNKIGGIWDGKQDFIDRLCRFALVAIDDLGAERDTEFMGEQVTSIIDSFYRAKVPLLITSNFSPSQIAGDCELRKRRVYDRLLERCHPIKVDGPSLRKAIGRADFQRMNEQLGL